MKPEIAAIIPARLSSSRLPGKVLLDINGISMLKRVVFNVLASDCINEVFVATCDEEVEEHIANLENVKTIKTSTDHTSGTSRCGEAIAQLNKKISHVILIQGDEPLLNPAHVDAMSSAICAHPEIGAFNAVSSVNQNEIEDESIVKCILNSKGELMFLFRKSPFLSNVTAFSSVKKVQGLMAFQKDYLKLLMRMEAGEFEKSESIEQMRILENGMVLKSVFTENVLQSVNTLRDLNAVRSYVEMIEGGNDPRK